MRQQYQIPKRQNHNQQQQQQQQQDTSFNNDNKSENDPRTASKFPEQIRNRFGFQKSQKTIPVPLQTVINNTNNNHASRAFNDISNDSGLIPRDPRVRRADGSITGSGSQQQQQQQQQQMMMRNVGTSTVANNPFHREHNNNQNQNNGTQSEVDDFSFNRTLDEDEMKERTPMVLQSMRTNSLVGVHDQNNDEDNNGEMNNIINKKNNIMNERFEKMTTNDSSRASTSSTTFMVPEVLYWKDPARTALHFFGGFLCMASAHALSTAKSSVFSHVAAFVSWVVMGKYLFAIAFPNAAKGISLSPEKMAMRARSVCYKFNAFTERHERFFAGKDNRATLITFIALQGVRFVGTALSTRDLLISAYILAFVMPCLFEKHKVAVYETYVKTQMSVSNRWREFSPKKKVASGICSSCVIFKLASTQTRVQAVFLVLVCYRIVKEQQIMKLQMQHFENAVVGSVRRMSSTFVSCYNMVSPVPTTKKFSRY